MKKLLVILVSTFLLLSTQAFASTIYSFNDLDKDWPGYSTSIPDEHGTPTIASMNVTLSDGGLLEKVDLVLAGSKTWQNFNSLFINSYNIDPGLLTWNDWDYFVHDGGNTNSNKTDPAGTIPGNGIYEVSQTGYQYTMTIDDPSIRPGNPNGIDAGSLSQIATGSHWSVDPSGYIRSYSFDTALNIDLSNGFFIAFSPFCANDIIGGGMELSPTPEPNTLILLGIGFIALAGIGRKKFMPLK